MFGDGSFEETRPPQAAVVKLNGKEYSLPIVEGTAGLNALDLTGFRTTSGYLTHDPGFDNTCGCRSEITFIDGERGILRFRGYNCDDLVRNCELAEVIQILIWGKLPTQTERDNFEELLQQNQMLHEELRHHFSIFPTNAHPVAILSAVISALACYHEDLFKITSEKSFKQAAVTLLGKVGTIAAFSYRKAHGLPTMYPQGELGMVENFLHMMFSFPYEKYSPPSEVITALQTFLILHADHGQNCATATVRMVASGGANLFAAVNAGILSLWGPGMGGMSQSSVTMLQSLLERKEKPLAFLNRIKAENRPEKLAGFGHNIYKTKDPRAALMKETIAKLLTNLAINEPLFDLANELESFVLADDFFKEREMFTTVDLYSGILLKILGVPFDMYQVMFAIARMPGWIAHWYEQLRQQPRIQRPRQLYVGPSFHYFIPIEAR